jgi:asparagine synthase (glutamine-hydrolysing)
MCGIAGFVPRTSSDPAELAAILRRMVGTLVHRGPDDEGLHVDPQVTLGMRRLEVIDRAGGHQPMYGADGSLVLVFNGEIYNYRALRQGLEEKGVRFHSHSDTEVLLRLLEDRGKAGLSQVEGMFAFALWDGRKRELMLARDWLGQKSLYWTQTPDGFGFASEIKALLTLPGVSAELELGALSDYMSLRYLPGDRTLFAGIYKLPPASLMTIRDRNWTVERLWRPAYEPKHRMSESELLEGLDERMRRVVSEHLISDVPLGAFLSGGVDSSLIVAYASGMVDEPLATFSVGVDEASQNELPWARRVASQYGTRHSEQVVQPDLAKLTPRMVASLEEPVDPFGAGVYIVSEIARREVTVALSGDGGDEIFAGYDRYKGQRIAELYASVPRALRHGLLRPLFRAIPDSFGYNSVTAKLRWLDRIADSEGFERYAESAAYLRFPHAAKQRLFTPHAWDRVGSSVSERLLQEYFHDGCAEAFLDRILHADCMSRLSENQLPITDRMSMAHSLELRSPFLDRRIVEYAMRIPAPMKLKKGRLKYVTRKLGERYLPRDLLYRPKKGFGFPLALWLRGPLRGLMARTIADSRLVAAGLFRSEELWRMHEEHAAGRVDHNYRLWMIFNIELFWRHFVDGEAVEDLESWVEASRAQAA